MHTPVIPNTYRRHRYPWLLVLLLLLVLSLGTTHAVEKVSTPNTSYTLQLRDGTLTARVTATPLRAVMAEVSRLSSAQVVWVATNGEQPISTEFTALPLDEGLQRLLARYNFMLVYTTQRDALLLARIWISSAVEEEVEAEPVPQPIASMPGASPANEEHWDEALGTFAQHDETTLSDAFLEEEMKAARTDHEE